MHPACIFDAHRAGMHWKTQLGRRGEQLAAAYLVRRGMAVIERNLRVGRAEVDLLCRDGAVHVLVEVKTRTGALFGAAVEAFDARKQRILSRAMGRYLAEHPEARSARIDLVCVELTPWGTEIVHVRNALAA